MGEATDYVVVSESGPTEWVAETLVSRVMWDPRGLLPDDEHPLRIRYAARSAAERSRWVQFVRLDQHKRLPSDIASASDADPVAVAASNNPMLTTLTAAVSGQLNPNALTNILTTRSCPDRSAQARQPRPDRQKVPEGRRAAGKDDRRVSYSAQPVRSVGICGDCWFQ